MDKQLCYLCSIFVILVAFNNCGPAIQLKNTDDFPVLEMGNIGTNSPSEQKALQIINSKCNACHGSFASGGLSNITDPVHLVMSGQIVPGSPTGSNLVQQIEGNIMPPGNNPLTPQEKADISSWIQNAFATPTPTPTP